MRPPARSDLRGSQLPHTEKGAQTTALKDWYLSSDPHSAGSIGGALILLHSNTLTRSPRGIFPHISSNQDPYRGLHESPFD